MDIGYCGIVVGSRMLIVILRSCHLSAGVLAWQLAKDESSGGKFYNFAQQTIRQHLLIRYELSWLFPYLFVLHV